MKSNFIRARILAPACFCLWIPAGATMAQAASARSPSPRPTEHVCAAALARTGELTSASTQEEITDALARASGCVPELGRGIANTMTAVRESRDTVLVWHAFQGAISGRDTAIMRAASSIARDPVASNVARTLSLMALYASLGGRQSTLLAFSAQPRGTSVCSLPVTTDNVKPMVLTPLPPDAPELARDAAWTVQRDPDAAAALISASYCVLEAWRSVRKLPSQHNWLFTPGGITAEYVCGTKFNVRNAYPVPVAPQMQIGSSSRYQIYLVGAPGSDEPSVTEVDIRKPGALTLFLDGEFLSVTENGGTPCR